MSGPSGDDSAGAIADRILAAARRAGADEAEAYFDFGRELTARAYQRGVESLDSARSRGLGLRVFQDTALGYAYTSDFGNEGLEHLVASAVANAAANSPDPANGLPELQAVPELDGLDPAGESELEAAPRIDAALEAEAACLSFDTRIRAVPHASYTEGRGEVALFNSRGFSGSYRSSAAFVAVEAVAHQDGEDQSAFAFAYGRKFGSFEPAAAGREAAEKAVALLGARIVPSQQVSVVFEPLVAAQLVGVVCSLLSAEAAQKGRTVFAAKLGEEVAAPHLVLRDDPLRLDALGARPFDDEGVPSRPLDMIAEGRLRSFLHNTTTARRAGVPSTGHAHRGGYRSTPEIAASNAFIKPGTRSPSKLIAGVSKGLYVMQVAGLHAINATSGRFSLGATGRWIEGGEFKHSVREVTIAGDFLGLLRQIVAVGDDLRFSPGGTSVGSPTLVAEGLTVSGS